MHFCGESRPRVWAGENKFRFRDLSQSLATPRVNPGSDPGRAPPHTEGFPGFRQLQQSRLQMAMGTHSGVTNPSPNRVRSTECSKSFQVVRHPPQLLEVMVDALLGFAAVLAAASSADALFKGGLLNLEAVGAAVGFAVVMSLLQSFVGLYRSRPIAFHTAALRLVVAVLIGGYGTYLMLKQFGVNGHPGKLMGMSGRLFRGLDDDDPRPGRDLPRCNRRAESADRRIGCRGPGSSR